MLVTASAVHHSFFLLMESMPTRSIHKLEVAAEEITKEMEAMHQCMLKMTSEIVDLRRRVDDVEGVLMEQFEDRSEVGSFVSIAPRYVTPVASLHK